MPEPFRQLSRRAFVRSGSLFLLGLGATRLHAADDPPRRVRIGLITDLHYADKPANGTRHYRDTPAKLAEAVKQFNADRPDFVVEQGDLIDAAATVETELGYLREISRVFDTYVGPKHYVLGNHCVDMLTKDEFLGGVGRKESFYSFDVGETHFIVLDACFRTDGKPYGRKSSAWNDANIPPAELDWLQSDLQAADKPTIVFAHQRLDNGGAHAVKNAAAVRQVFEASGRVRAVFQGHSHKNDHQEIAGIHYTTLVAMVEGPNPESNGYSFLDILANGTLRLTGFRKQANYRWPATN
jgi:3',5'-cyclic AMP phosphodiesterase CpdA